MKKIKLMIVDEHALVRKSWRAVLKAETDCEVVADTACPREALLMAKQQVPDVITMDITLPGSIPGLEVAEQFNILVPTAKILCISAYADIRTIKKAMHLGLKAISPKMNPWQNL